MSKLFKKDTKQFLSTLHKLTDNRFSFNIVRSFENGVSGYNLETSFCGNYITSCSIADFDITTAVDCLIDLVNYAELVKLGYKSAVSEFHRKKSNIIYCKKMLIERVKIEDIVQSSEKSEI